MGSFDLAAPRMLQNAARFEDAWPSNALPGWIAQVLARWWPRYSHDLGNLLPMRCDRAPAPTGARCLPERVVLYGFVGSLAFLYLGWFLSTLYVPLMLSSVTMLVSASLLSQPSGFQRWSAFVGQTTSYCVMSFIPIDRTCPGPLPVGLDALPVTLMMAWRWWYLLSLCLSGGSTKA